MTQVFKTPVEQADSMTLNIPVKPTTRKMLDDEVRSMFKNRQEGLDYINSNFQEGDEKVNAMKRLDRVYPSTRQKWNNYFKHMGDGNPNTIDKYNKLLGEIESELPFKNDVEHDQWSQMLEVYKGEPEFDNMMEEILKRTDSGYSGQDEAEKYAKQYFARQIGGYKPNPNIVKRGK